MKKFTFKSLTLKLLALVVAVCAGVAVATVSSEKPVAFAAETQESVFAIQGAGIRYPEVADETVNGEDKFYKGIRFETKLSKSWLDVNDAEKVGKYYYGTLIFPAKNIGAFDENLGSTANKENLEAVKVIRGQGEELTSDVTFYASLVYDSETIAELFGNKFETSLTEAQLENVLKHLYAMDMTAISYVQYGDTIKYSAPYTDSMIKVAARLQSNKDWAERAKAYLGDGEVETIKTYAVDDNNIVKGFDAQNVSIVAIGNETLTAGVDYTIENGVLTLNADYVKANKGVYEDIFVFDANNNLTIINVLYATDEITTADEYMSTVVYEDYDYSTQEAYKTAVALDEASRTPEQQALVDAWTKRYAVKDGVYVLANDIDLTGKTIRNSVGGKNIAHWNSMPAVVKGGAFTGIFDGFGHVVSNATLSISMYYPYPASYLASTGLFASIKAGAAVRNVAFDNLTIAEHPTNRGYNTWTGIITDQNLGTIENVYIDVNAFSANRIGGVVIDNLSGATIKNVVVNYPLEFDYSYHSKEYSHRGYGGNGGVGSFVTGERYGKIENAFVIGKYPIGYVNGQMKTNVTDSEALTIDFFYYAENETDLWFKHTVLDTLDPDNAGKHTVQTAVANNANGKARVVKGVRRYDSLSALSNDADANVQALLDTGMFKKVNGQIVWNTLKLGVLDKTAIDYEASTGTVDSSLFNSIENIEKIIVNGIELTEGNGFNYVGDKVVLAQRPDDSSEIAGVPYISKISANKDQLLVVEVHTEHVIYTFNNVTFWTEIFTTGEEFDEKYDYGRYDANKAAYPRHEGYYTLGNDIDMAGLTVENHVNYAYKQDPKLVGAGLKGTFDGRGYAIHNATLDLTVISNAPSTGFFGTLFEGSLLQNVALLNLTVKTGAAAGDRSWTGILTGNNYDYYNGKASSYNMVGSIKNVYVDVAPGSTSYYAGLVAKVDDYGRTSMENVVLNHPTATFNYEEGASARTKMLFSDDGVGSIFGKGGNQGSHDRIKNVYAIAPIPVAAIRFNSNYSLDSSALDNDYFYYGANESKVWFNHTINGEKTFSELAAENGKVRVLAGVRRYNDMNAFVADNSTANSDMAKVLTETGFFKLDKGQILWHTQKAKVFNDTAIDYEASTGEMKSTAISDIDVSTIEKIVVNGIELTQDPENSGFEIVNGKIVFNQRKDKTSEIAGIPYLVNGDNQTLIVDIYTANYVYSFTNVTYWTDIITTAEEFESVLDYGAYDKNNTSIYDHKNDGFYALGNDINMSSVVIENVCDSRHNASGLPANMANAGFYGLFDGRGYTLSNINLDNYSDPTPKTASGGLFGKVYAGAVIKNTAFVGFNVNVNATNTYRSWTGVLCSDMSGTLENIYVDMSGNERYVSGIASQITSSATLTNVFVKYQRDVAFDYLTDTKTQRTRGLYVNDGFGAIAGIFNATKVTNVYVESNMPIVYDKYLGVPQDSDNTTHDFFWYGENETKEWFDYTYNNDKTFEELKADNIKVRVKAGVRRYDDMSALTGDTSDKNVAGIEALKATNFFKVVAGQLLWHTQKALVADVDTAIDYEASTGELLSTEFADIDVNAIERIFVNGIELTLENGGYSIVDGKVVFTQRPDAESVIAGVPFIENVDGFNNQDLEIIVELKDTVYKFTNVTFWSEILTTAQDVLDMFSRGNYDADKTYATNYKFVTLAGDIDMNDLGEDNVILNNTSSSTAGAIGKDVFAGYLDGRGFAIKNAFVNASNVDKLWNGGFFNNVYGSSSTAKAEVKNIAFLNYKAILTGGKYYQGALAREVGKANFENVYIDINPETSINLPLFYNISWEGATFKNFFVNRGTPEDYVFDAKTATTYAGYCSTYGAFSAEIATSTSLTETDYFGVKKVNAYKSNITATSDNIYFVTKMPLQFNIGSSKIDVDSINALRMFIAYGLNETELMYKFPALDVLYPEHNGNHTVANTKSFVGDKGVYVDIVVGQDENGDDIIGNVCKNGLTRTTRATYRYNTMSDLVGDTSATNLANLEKFKATGLFKVENGQLLWHSQA